jgi:hypothetical protein
MSKNFRDAAAITHEYSLLSSSSPVSVFEALDKRWGARVDEANAFSDRFEAQQKKSP